MRREPDKPARTQRVDTITPPAPCKDQTPPKIRPIGQPRANRGSRSTSKPSEHGEPHASPLKPAQKPPKPSHPKERGIAVNFLRLKPSLAFPFASTDEPSCRIHGLIRADPSLPSFALLAPLACGLPSEFSGGPQMGSEFPHATVAKGREHRRGRSRYTKFIGAKPTLSRGQVLRVRLSDFGLKHIASRCIVSSVSFTGALNALILQNLCAGPNHGYRIAQEIKQ